MLERLNQAMEHIEGHLDQDLDVKGWHASPPPRSTTCAGTALAGMPLLEYVRRRRLTLAGAEVLAGRETLLEIAVRYGYGYGEAFARAFRVMHGIGPGEARRTDATLTSQSRMAFRLTGEGSSSMRYRVVDKADFTVVGLKTRVPLVHAGPNRAITDSVPAGRARPGRDRTTRPGLHTSRHGSVSGPPPTPCPLPAARRRPGQGVPAVPAQRKARREYENRVSTLVPAGP